MSKEKKNDTLKSASDVVKDKVSKISEEKITDEPDTEKQHRNSDNSSAGADTASDTTEAPVMPHIDFISYILMIGTVGMQQLGKITNPITGKIEKDLLQVKNTIDLLEILEEKTKGNLTEDEDKVLKSTLTNLRLNYIDETK